MSKNLACHLHTIYDDGKGGGGKWWVAFCVVELSYFGLCNVLCTEGLRSSAVYLGDFPR